MRLGSHRLSNLGFCCDAVMFTVPQMVLQNACRTCLGDYQNQLNQFGVLEEDGGELQVPQRFRDSMQSLQEQYHALSARDKQRINKVAETVASWEEFRGGLEELTSWVRSEEMELAELRGLESFAMEFPSHKTRLLVSPAQGGEGSGHKYFARP